MESSERRSRILAALRRSQPPPATEPLPPASDIRIFRDFITATPAVLAVHFAGRLQALQGECHLAGDTGEAARLLQTILASVPGGRVLVQDHAPLIELLQRDSACAARCDILRGGEPNDRLADYAIGITTADFLIARTGSVVFRSTSAGGRRLSVLPPVHIVVAAAGRLVPSLEQALNALRPEESWSQASIITGPSRTADIQKNLVLGAHGPKRLVVIITGLDQREIAAARSTVAQAAERQP